MLVSNIVTLSSFEPNSKFFFPNSPLLFEVAVLSLLTIYHLNLKGLSSKICAALNTDCTDIWTVLKSESDRLMKD